MKIYKEKPNNLKTQKIDLNELTELDNHMDNINEEYHEKMLLSFKSASKIKID
jgi:hypothetical protein